MQLKKISLAVALSFAFSGSAISAPHVNVKIIAINDFHGQLESPGSLRNQPGSSTPSTAVGGIDWLAGYIEDIKSKNPNTLVVSAGDLIGATPLISALFHDEPTIETMNRAGLDINAVGNHEFDDGKDELLRMQNGGCHPTSTTTCSGAQASALLPPVFEGADFEFLAANVQDRKTGQTIFPGYTIKEFNGIKIAFIGLTLKETPTIVTPSGVAGLRFTDEVNSINKIVKELSATGVKAYVVLIHQGGTVPTTQSVDTINACDGGLVDSRIKTIVNGLWNAVDLVISGHTHQAYNCMIATRDGKHLIPVTSANSQGRVFTEIDMKLNSKGTVLSVNATNKIVDRTNAAITPNADIAGIVAGYKTLVTPIANRVIGSISETLSRTQNPAGESAMGDVIADAQFTATKEPKFGGAQIAFMNPGGVRADLTFTGSTAGEGDGNVTFGEAFTVQPFGNSLVTMTVTGAQIEELLEQQFVGCPNGQTSPRILYVSNGFSYTWDNNGAACDKINPNSIMLNGAVVDPTASYRITVNSFMATGGDLFTVLPKGTNLLGGAQDSDALEAYFKANSPISAPVANRVTRLN